MEIAPRVISITTTLTGRNGEKFHQSNTCSIIHFRYFVSTLCGNSG